MYSEILKKQALNNITKFPNIPDYHLMIGSAENLSSLPLLLYTSASIPKAVVDNMEFFRNTDNEKIAEMINNNQIEINDMNWNIATMGL